MRVFTYETPRSVDEAVQMMGRASAGRGSECRGGVAGRRKSEGLHRSGSPRRLFDRGANIRIGAAATDIAAHPFLDRLVG